MAATRQPTLYIPHGGGPCFFMEWTIGPPDTWVPMGNYLRAISASLPEPPRSVLVISGHWESADFRVTGGAQPPLIYDYYGFPAHTYELRYNAPGDPVLAMRVANLLSEAGLVVGIDADRGFDHGVFIPLKLMLPDADIPVVQLSLRQSLDPTAHLAAGQALAPLRDEGVLIVGSGMSFHNMHAFRHPAGYAAHSERFDRWLVQTITSEPAVRHAELAAWASAPSARESHPREEHLLPLMVAAGAGGADIGRCDFTGRVMGTVVSGFRFG